MIRWVIPNSQHMPIEVRCERSEHVVYDDMFDCYRTSDDSFVFSTGLAYLYGTEIQALMASYSRQAQKAATELRKWDEISDRIVEVA